MYANSHQHITDLMDSLRFQNGNGDFFLAIEKIAGHMYHCHQNGGTIYTCGNGGSHADAMHLTAELVGRFYIPRKAIKSVTLGSQTCNTSSIGNDFSFENALAREVEGNLNPQLDMLFAFSTSGTSVNILRVVEIFKESSNLIVAMLGKESGTIGQLADIALLHPSSKTPTIQELHTLSIHMIVSELERQYLKRG